MRTVHGCGLTSSHRHRTSSEVRPRGGIRYGLRPSRLPPRERRLIWETEEPDIDLHLSTSDRHAVRVHEYLMPALVMKEPRFSLLEQTNSRAVTQQIQFGVAAKALQPVLC